MLVHEAAIMEMRAQGLSRREITEKLGLNMKQLHNFITRHNNRAKATPTTIKPRGRPRKRPITTTEEQTLRIKELEREVAMLRSFLLAVGRM